MGPIPTTTKTSKITSISSTNRSLTSHSSTASFTKTTTSSSVTTTTYTSSSTTLLESNLTETTSEIISKTITGDIFDKSNFSTNNLTTVYNTILTSPIQNQSKNLNDPILPTNKNITYKIMSTISNTKPSFVNSSTQNNIIMPKNDTTMNPSLYTMKNSTFLLSSKINNISKLNITENSNNTVEEFEKRTTETINNRINTTTSSITYASENVMTSTYLNRTLGFRILTLPTTSISSITKTPFFSSSNLTTTSKIQLSNLFENEDIYEKKNYILKKIPNKIELSESTSNIDVIDKTETNQLTITTTPNYIMYPSETAQTTESEIKNQSFLKYILADSLTSSQPTTTLINSTNPFYFISDLDKELNIDSFKDLNSYTNFRLEDENENLIFKITRQTKTDQYEKPELIDEKCKEIDDGVSCNDLDCNLEINMNKCPITCNNPICNGKTTHFLFIIIIF